MEQTYEELKERVAKLEKELEDNKISNLVEDIEKLRKNISSSPLCFDIQEVCDKLQKIIEMGDTGLALSSYNKLNERWSEIQKKQSDLDVSLLSFEKLMTIIKAIDVVN